MKFGWLKDYLEVIWIWSQMVMMTRTLETQLKRTGFGSKREELNPHSALQSVALINYI
jgi:hypothetical protein